MEGESGKWNVNTFHSLTCSHKSIFFKISIQNLNICTIGPLSGETTPNKRKLQQHYNKLPGLFDFCIQLPEEDQPSEVEKKKHLEHCFLNLSFANKKSGMDLGENSVGCGSPSTKDTQLHVFLFSSVFKTCNLNMPNILILLNALLFVCSPQSIHLLGPPFRDQKSMLQLSVFLLLQLCTDGIDVCWQGSASPKYACTVKVTIIR